jgi:hypothetical protein
VKTATDFAVDELRHILAECAGGIEMGVDGYLAAYRGKPPLDPRVQWEPRWNSFDSEIHTLEPEERRDAVAFDALRMISQVLTILFPPDSVQGSNDVIQLSHRQGAEHSDDKDTNMTETLTDNNGVIEDLQAQLKTQRELAVKRYRDLESFKAQVSESIKTFVDNDQIELETAKELCEELGIKAPQNSYDVEVTIVLTISGVVADDEDDAEQQVRNNLSVEGNVEEYDSEDWDVSDVTVTEA